MNEIDHKQHAISPNFGRACVQGPLCSFRFAQDERNVSCRARRQTATTHQRWVFVLSIFLVLGLVGCATPVGVNRIGEKAVFRQLTGSILTGKDFSSFSRQYLARFSLAERYKEDPMGVLADLHAGLGGIDTHDRLFALAELSYACAERKKNKTYYLASAMYAYAFLFPEGVSEAPIPYDPRTRLAAGLYKYAIIDGLRVGKGDEIDLKEQRVTLPFGELHLFAESEGYRFGGYPLTTFHSVSEYEVRGLRNRYRRVGIGIPVSCPVGRVVDESADPRISPNAKVPMTVFVRFAKSRGGLSDSEFTGKIELYDASDTESVAISEYSVPLEYEPTVSLAYSLESSTMWSFGKRGFLNSTFNLFKTKEPRHLFFTAPYHPGRIPVVFIHGTASSPARWAEMFNELLGDARIAGRYQFWYAIYNTGNPIAISSMQVREALTDAITDIDPDGKDEALQKMVVIGHSQGGLLTKMTVVNSGNRFWENISDDPFDDAKLTSDTRDLLKRSIFVEPLPFVSRVIFVSTPHHGSFLAEGFFGKLGSKFVNLPPALLKVGKEMVTLDPKGVAREIRIPTAVDNMDWSSPFLQTLASLPIAEGVKSNSIIPVKGNGPYEEGDDGVVRYKSAHIDGVESELVVRSGHSTQSEPETIEEIRRILYEHAAIR